MSLLLEDGLTEARRRIATATGSHIIDGCPAPGRGEEVDVLNPATSEVLRRVTSGTPADVDAAVAAARAASAGWRRRPPAERARLLFALADVIDAHTDLFAAIETLNVGKPHAVAQAEIPLASDALRFMAGAVRTAQAPAAGEYAEGHLSFVVREAVGVVGAVTPWNYPLMMAMWKVAPALAAGNTVVLKPSELTPLSTVVFAELAVDILPPGVLNVVLGTGPVVGEALTSHPGVDMVSLTGSVRSGRSVATNAAATTKRVHLELGGKAPVIVFADADLDEVAGTVATMGFWNSGQECGSATRVLCEPEIHDALVERLVAHAEALRVGDPAQDGTTMGPLISDAQVERVASAVRVAVEGGAVLATGGTRPDRVGFYYAPTVLTRITEGSAILREEVFGPVITVETFSGEADAVARANAVAYGLAASVWTENGGRALRVVDGLDFGTVWVNSHLTLAAEMPWGGFGASGYGRDMSTLALDDYTRTKHVMLAKRDVGGTGQ